MINIPARPIWRRILREETENILKILERGLEKLFD
jgi:hypothetical protein